MLPCWGPTHAAGSADGRQANPSGRPHRLPSLRASLGLNQIDKALNRFETYTRFRDFKAFHIEQAKGFKASLANQTSFRTKNRLSKATLYATLTSSQIDLADSPLHETGASPVLGLGVTVAWTALRPTSHAAVVGSA